MKPTSLDAMMSSLVNCLDRPSLQSIVELRASPEAEERVEWLAERANEGQLTKEESAEYGRCIQLSSFLGILQSKARNKLRGA